MLGIKATGRGPLKFLVRKCQGHPYSCGVPAKRRWYCSLWALVLEVDRGARECTLLGVRDLHRIGAAVLGLVELRGTRSLPALGDHFAKLLLCCARRSDPILIAF
jgi:hypothetical protein